SGTAAGRGPDAAQDPILSGHPLRAPAPAPAPRQWQCRRPDRRGGPGPRPPRRDWGPGRRCQACARPARRGSPAGIPLCRAKPGLGARLAASELLRLGTGGRRSPRRVLPMASRSLVIKVTAGKDDLERCNQGFTVAATAAASGLQISLWLTGEASWLALPGRADDIALPYAAPLAELLAKILEAGTVTLCTQ